MCATLTSTLTLTLFISPKQEGEDGYILSPTKSSFEGKIGPNLKLCGKVSSACCKVGFVF